MPDKAYLRASMSAAGAAEPTMQLHAHRQQRVTMLLKQYATTATLASDVRDCSAE